jgi:hypothetical protein
MSFPDVPESHWAFDAIQWGVENNLISGFGDGTFRPSSGVSRAQLMIILKRYHENLSGNPVEEPIPPVDPPPISGINYTELVLEDHGSSLDGSLVGSIGKSRFYKVVVPHGRSMAQIAVAGINTMNVNMLITDRGYSSAESAISSYKNYFELYGYENFENVPEGLTNFWFWVRQNYESEYIPIQNPLGGTYFILLYNEGTESANFRLEGHVW